MAWSLSDFYLIVKGMVKHQENIDPEAIQKSIKRSEKSIASDAEIILTNPMDDINDKTELPAKLYWLLIVNAAFELMVQSGGGEYAILYRNEYRKEKAYLISEQGV